MLGFVDHGGPTGGEPVAELLRPGKAGSNTASDHITVLDAALAQLPSDLRVRDDDGRVAVLVRTDAAGATAQFAAHLHAHGVEFSVGASFAHLDVATALTQLPAAAWTPAYQARRPRAAETGVQIEPRDGAWVAEATGLIPLTGWPPGTRLLLRKERPHPGAQLRITDADGLRVTGFLTNTTRDGPHRQLAELELRHRRHARVEDRGRRRTPACGTCLSTTPTRTGSGSPSARSPRTCWPGAPGSPCPLLPPATNPNGCGCGSSPPPDGSCAPPADTSCTSTPPGPGPSRSPPRTHAWARSPFPDPPHNRPIDDLEHRQTHAEPETMHAHSNPAPNEDQDA